MNYYNEYDKSAAAWLRELISRGLIPPGVVDERSIADVGADDLRGFTQCHFFAGISGWSLALRLAGWPDDRPVWTGSCPCQPFSTAGKRLGFDDERDLWPTFFALIKACRPAVVIGEQVASSEVVGSEQEAAFVVAVQTGDYARANKLARKLISGRSFSYRRVWVDRVRADLAGEGYAVRHKVLGAHSLGAPHRRYRLYWGAVAMADVPSNGYPPANGLRKEIESPEPNGEIGERELARGSDDSRIQHLTGDGRDERRTESGRGCASGGCGSSAMANDDGKRLNRERISDVRRSSMLEASRSSSSFAVADCDDSGLERRNGSGECSDQRASWEASVAGLSPWHNSGLVYCRDEKIRRIPAESILFSVADGVSSGVDGSGDCVRISTEGGFPLCKKGEVPNRVTLLRGYGNAINPYCGKIFVESFMEELDEKSI